MKFTIIFAALLVSAVSAQTAPFRAPLLYRDNLRYDGAFRVPAGSHGGSRFGYGEDALANQATFLPGDANLDGAVDVSDFNRWHAHRFAADGGWCGGDFNADGVVDDADLGIWIDHRFQVAGTLENVVPEPGMLCCLVIVCGVSCCRRRR